MSELIRSLIFVLILSSIAFGIAGYALPSFLKGAEFRRWRNLWFIIVFAAYLSHNMWLFVGVYIVATIFFIPSDPKSRVIYFLVLLFALPILMVDIPAVGIRYLFSLTYPRLLILTLLLLPMLKSRSPMRLYALTTDKWVMLYVCLLSVAAFRDNTYSNALRASFLFFVDIFVPYFMLSRYLTDQAQLNRALVALLVGMAPVACIAVFETVKHWHLYNVLTIALTGKDPSFGYDIRGGGLRATAIFKGPIILGYVMLIGIGLFLYLKPMIKNQKTLMLVGLGLLGGLLASVARGPWVACVILGAAFIWTGSYRLSRLALFGLSGVVSLALLSLTEKGSKFIDLLPIIGSVRSDTIDYRARLIDMSWIVFKRHPWFGSTTYLETPEMQSMIQGQGIIDIVNSYIQIALANGLAGLALFGLIFFGLLLKCYLLIKRLPSDETDLVRMGRVLFATLCGMLLTIFTTSSVDYVPVLYWAYAGILAAYVHVAEKTIKQHKVNVKFI